jgi:hypothetical protein
VLYGFPAVPNHTPHSLRTGEIKGVGTHYQALEAPNKPLQQTGAALRLFET